MLGGADGYAQLRRQRGDREAYARMRKGVECMHGTLEISGDRGRAWESVGDAREREAHVCSCSAQRPVRGLVGVGGAAWGRWHVGAWGRACG